MVVGALTAVHNNLSDIKADSIFDSSGCSYGEGST